MTSSGFLSQERKTCRTISRALTGSNFPCNCRSCMASSIGLPDSESTTENPRHSVSTGMAFLLCLRGFQLGRHPTDQPAYPLQTPRAHLRPDLHHHVIGNLVVPPRTGLWQALLSTLVRKLPRDLRQRKATGLQCPDLFQSLRVLRPIPGVAAPDEGRRQYATRDV